MLATVKIRLSQAEYSALLQFATEDLRNLDDQARYIIRKELERKGILSGGGGIPTYSPSPEQRIIGDASPGRPAER